MDLDEEISLEHLLFQQRRCRTCNKVKDLMDGFYLTRKDRGDIPSSYSYECKECTKKRVTKTRKDNPDIPYWSVPRIKDVYPDW